MGPSHTLSESSCSIGDWLGMALMSGLAFGIGLVLLLAGAALLKYLFSERREGAR